MPADYTKIDIFTFYILQTFSLEKLFLYRPVATDFLLCSFAENSF